MKEQLKKTKSELKALAQQIKNKRQAYKQSQRECDWNGIWKNDPSGLAHQFRHMHIAYCILRGRTLEQIERSNRLGNEPNQDLIDRYIEEIKNETVCSGKSGPIEVAASRPGGTCTSGMPPVAADAQAAQGVEQPDPCLPEGKGLTFLGRIKSFFG